MAVRAWKKRIGVGGQHQAASVAPSAAVDPLLALQKRAGNQATLAMIARRPDATVQRRIDTTAGTLTRLRSWSDGPLVGSGTFDKLVKAIDAYHGRQPGTPELPLVQTIAGLAQHWVAGHSKEKSSAKRAQLDAVIQVQAEAEREIGILRAQAIYLDHGEQTRTKASGATAAGNQFDAMTAGGSSSTAEMGMPVAAKVAIGKAGEAPAAFGANQEAEALATRFKLTPAELAAVRIFTLGDYTYINPAVAQNRKWLLDQQKGRLVDPNSLKTSDELAAAPRPALPQVPGTMPSLPKLPPPGRQANMPPVPKTPSAVPALPVRPEVRAAEQRVKGWMDEGRMHAGLVMQAVEKLPPWKGVCFRGARFTPTEAAESFAVGKKLEYRTFASTSLSRATAEGFADGTSGNTAPAPDRTASVMVILTLRNGRDIQALSAAGAGEREILLLPGAEFTIVEATKRTSGAAGRPEATEWYTISAVQTDAAAMRTTPDGADGGVAKTERGSDLPRDPVGQLALSETQRMLELAEKAEPKVTAKLSEVARAHGAKLTGLDHRFKTEPALVRKITEGVRARAKPGEDPAQAINEEIQQILDTLSYTFVVPEKRHASFAATLPEALKAAQMTMRPSKDPEARAPHQGIDQTYEFMLTRKCPVPFEVQIHTSASLKKRQAPARKSPARKR